MINILDVSWKNYKLLLERESNLTNLAFMLRLEFLTCVSLNETFIHITTVRSVHMCMGLE